MVLELALSDDMENASSGSDDDVPARSLMENLNREATQDDRQRLMELLCQWAKEDAEMTDEEEASNLEVLRSIDEYRGSGRKLFSDILDARRQ